MFNSPNTNGRPQTNRKKARTVTLSIAATIFSILYARGLTIGQINVLGNLFQAMGEQMATISSIVRAPFDEGEEDRMISSYSRSQYFMLQNKIDNLKQQLIDNINKEL